MKEELEKKLLHKKLNRKEFLQFMGASLLVLFGLSNLITFIRQLTKSPETITQTAPQDLSQGFGSRKFGA